MILGLDLSVRAAAAIAGPLSWDGDWTQLSTKIVGEPLRKGASERERIDRCVRLGVSLSAFAREHGVTDVYIEGYAYGQATAAHTLGELGGLVRLGLMRTGIDLHVANMSSSRKLMCGTIPRSADKKAVVQATLRRAGAPALILDSGDLCDAFVCLNWGMSELGGYCFAVAA